ncbi:hypothetical protein HYR99_02540 [Candidatus Poribacteria bacterium]|nr:hypothetical protein [Candidatus Poribacteria bacterium]
MKLYFAIWASLLLLAAGFIGVPDGLAPEEEPSLAGTLAWLRKLDENYDRPRFHTLTTESLKTLTSITLGGQTKDGGHVHIPAEEFRYLTPLTALKRANLGEIEGLSDEALAHIGKLTSLMYLHLHDGELTDAGMKHLVNLKDLRLLVLGANRAITDAGLAEVVKLKNLEDLRISYTQVTDTGMKMLQMLPHLQALRIINTPVTDEGIRHLTPIKGLTELYINYPENKQVTPEAIAELQKALPNLKINPTSQLEPSRDDVELAGAWFYDDLEAGYAEARRTGRPLLIVFR